MSISTKLFHFDSGRRHLVRGVQGRGGQVGHRAEDGLRRVQVKQTEDLAS